MATATVVGEREEAEATRATGAEEMATVAVATAMVVDRMVAAWLEAAATVPEEVETATTAAQTVAVAMGVVAAVTAASECKTSATSRSGRNRERPVACIRPDCTSCRPR